MSKPLPLDDMSDDELVAERAELGRQMKQLGSRVAAMHGRLGSINAALKRRRAADSDRFEITDHAVLRFLERAKGLDVAAVRAEIVTLLQRAIGVKHEHGKGALRNGDLVFLVKDRRVQTMYRTDEMPDISEDPS